MRSLVEGTLQTKEQGIKHCGWATTGQLCSGMLKGMFNPVTAAKGWANLIKQIRCPYSPNLWFNHLIDGHWISLALSVLLPDRRSTFWFVLII